MSRPRVLLLVLLAACPAVAPAAPAKPTAEQLDFVERKVRPILVDSCLRCHGAKRQLGGLRLDSREAILRGGDNGPVIDAGHPEQSPLVEAIRRTGKLKMPPRKPLPPGDVETLAAWVKMGTPWPETSAAVKADADARRRHWAFQPVRKPPLPTIRREDWPRTSVDRFILAALEKQQLTPSPAADRRTLLRRVSYDLIGLPPTPEEIAAFEADTSSDPYARVVDRLLASPHYGERWGRHWLDVARYADTKGYVFFQEGDYPWAYTYRDYLIRSFNEDLPYDQFLLQQLAADQLPLGKERRPLAALGFITVGGRFMNNVQDILDDRIDVVTRGLLGLTVSCARCHDHKFDPIPTRDYYALYGVFASSVEPEEEPLFTDPPRTPAYRKFQKELAARDKKLSDFLNDKYAQLISKAKTRAAEYLLAAHAGRNQPRIDDFMIIAEGNELNPLMIARWQAFLRRTRKERDPVFAAWHLLADLPEKDFASRAKELCIRLTSGQVGDTRIHPLVAKALASKPPATLADAARCYGELLTETDRLWQEALRRAAQSKQPTPTRLEDPLRESLRQVFYRPDAPSSIPLSQIDDLSLLPDRPSQDVVQKLRKSVREWRTNGPGAPPRAMALVDAPVPYDPCVFIRGNPNNRGELVPRQLPELLAGPKRQPFRHGSGRLELARAIAARGNPLTARVLVNRVWLHHFGKGLVSTPSDFGLRSDPPTHRNLLDHLATTFMDQGWSIKKLHRLIVLSATYQQQSDDRPDCKRADPENRLVWKMNRRRLDFEAVRDTLLAVSGRLDPTVGGPSVKDVLSPACRRRTLYGHIDRLHVPGLFRAFDFPSPDASSPQRDQTMIPQQALFFMNDPLVVECARQLVQQPEVAREKDCARRVSWLYRRLFGRPPTADETHLAAELIGSSADAALWTRYVQGLMMTNEMAFVD
jgi:hypothetical protein